MNHPRPLPQNLLAACLAAIALLALVAAASPSHRAHARARHRAARTVAAQPAPAAPAAAQGVVVGLDPETGRLGMPSADQMLQLTPAEKTGLMHTASDLSPIRMPDGTVMLDLQGRFMEYSVLSIDAAGRPRIGCVDDARSLARVFGPPLAPAPAPAPAPALEVK